MTFFLRKNGGQCEENYISCLKLEQIKHIVFLTKKKQYLFSLHHYVQLIRCFQYSILLTDEKLTEKNV